VKCFSKLFFIAILGLFLVINSAKCFGTISVGINPFSVQAPPELSYLKKGLQNLLVSRLTVPGKVQAIALGSAISIPVQLGESLNPSAAARLRSRAGTDYLLTGTVTAVGQAVSVDTWLYDLRKGGQPEAFTAQALSLNDVVQKVTQMANLITARLSGSSRTVVSHAEEVHMTQTSKSSNAKPSALDVLLGPMMQGQNISYLNPNFIEITPETALGNLGVWRSQTFKGGFVGMDVGDVDGDGGNEIVVVTYEKLMIFKRQGAGLRTTGTYDAGKMDKFIWCSLIDLDNDGRSEIVVTNLRKKNLTAAGYDNSSSKVNTEFFEPASMLFRCDGKAVRMIAKNIPYFLNVVSLNGERVLIGQRQAPNGGFDQPIYEMTFDGQRVLPRRDMALPKYCNVFNFVVTDIDNNGSSECVVILPNNKLAIYRLNGSRLWKSRRRFGATTNYILGKADDPRYNDVDYYYIPSPLLVTDLNEDGIKEIVANRSPEYSRFLPAGFKYYESSEVVSLSWGQVGLIENWATREIGGMVTSLRISDSDNNGVPELIVSVILGKDLLQLWKSESVIFSYDLNLKKKGANKQ